MTLADLIAAVRTVKPDLSERECLAIVMAVLGVVRESLWEHLKAVACVNPEKAVRVVMLDSETFTAMIDALLGEISDTR
jgi:hypothetical protein